MTKHAGILFGGKSPEYEVSLRSASAILRAFPPSHIPVPIGITRGGEWFYYTGDIAHIENDTWHKEAQALAPISVPHLGERTLCAGGVPLSIDVIFPAVHGAGMEDGRLQGALDTLGIPYVGCGVGASAIGMNKHLAKTLLRAHGIPCVEWCTVREEDTRDLDRTLDRIERTLSYPLFIKPISGGSSIGCAVVHSRSECSDALATLPRGGVLVERYVTAREIELAVVESKFGIEVSLPGEIVPNAPFYDYDTKYRTGKATLSVPAQLPPAVTAACRRMADRVFRLLGCRHFARVDLFVTPNKTVLFNEINTLPGFTSDSMLPLLCQRMGYPLDALLSLLLDEGESGA